MNAIDLHISKQTHGKGRKRRDGRRRRHSITPNALDTQEVLLIRIADRIIIGPGTDTRTAGIRDNRGVNGDNVGHGEEGGKAGADLGEEVGALALAALVDSISIESFWLEAMLHSSQLHVRAWNATRREPDETTAAGGATYSPGAVEQEPPPDRTSGDARIGIVNPTHGGDEPKASV